MTKEKWIQHMEEISGLTRPSKGGNVEEWLAAKASHKNQTPDCRECNDRRKTRRATASRKAREQLMIDCGLVKGKTALGRTIWE